jgi:hypothetical protein
VLEPKLAKAEGDDGINEEGWNCDLVVKLSWPPASRSEIIVDARKAADCEELR